MLPVEVLTLVELIIAPQQLNEVQQIVLNYCWQGISYPKIAEISGYDTDYIKETGAILWNLLSKATGERVNKKNVRSILENCLLETEGSNQTTSSQNWGDAPNASIFYGREKELATLQEWIITDKCRLIDISKKLEFMLSKALSHSLIDSYIVRT